MTNVATLMPEPGVILGCTVSRDVQNFEVLIEDMETELGESWGDLGFDDAVAFLGQPDSAHLEFLAVAVGADDQANLAPIGRVIRRAKEKGVATILVADQISPAGLHQLLRLGADDFLPYPLPDGALHESIAKLRTAKASAAAVKSAAEAAAAAQAFASAAAQPTPTAPVEPHGEAHPTFKPKGDREGFVLAVHGLAGGTGASTFAVNLAWELASADKANGPRVCILDLDFQYGSVATYLDLPRREAVFELLSDVAAADGEALLATMLTYNDRLHVLTAPADMLPLDVIGPEEIGRIIDTARANFDFVIIDMPKTIVVWTEAVLHRATLYFGTMELDLRSAQNILRLVRALKAEGLPHEKLRFVLNRAPRFTDLSAKARVKRMAESLDISLELQLPDGGAQVTQCNDHGLPLADNAAKNPLRRDIQKLAKSLLDLNKAAATAKA